MMVQLEDVAGVVEQANMPGTVNEQPNWRRKLPVPLHALATGERMQGLAAQLRAARPASRPDVRESTATSPSSATSPTPRASLSRKDGSNVITKVSRPAGAWRSASAATSVVFPTPPEPTTMTNRPSGIDPLLAFRRCGVALPNHAARQRRLELVGQRIDETRPAIVRDERQLHARPGPVPREAVDTTASPQPLIE